MKPLNHQEPTETQPLLNIPKNHTIYHTPEQHAKAIYNYLQQKYGI